MLIIDIQVVTYALRDNIIKADTINDFIDLCTYQNRITSDGIFKQYSFFFIHIE